GGAAGAESAETLASAGGPWRCTVSRDELHRTARRKAARDRNPPSRPRPCRGGSREPRSRGSGARQQGGLGDRERSARDRGARGSVSTYPDDLRELIEKYLAGLRFSAIPETEGLDEAMRYSLLAGGNRIRPVLALATSRSLAVEPESMLPAAAAIELIHTYSLIHDDLPAMDDDDLRRGRATSHVVFGENVAILAGDGLFAEALRLFTEHQQGEPASVLAALRELLAAKIGRASCRER